YSASAHRGLRSFPTRRSSDLRLDNCKALAEIDLKSGRIATLAVDPAWDFDAPRYAPDGRRIAFAAANQGRRHTAPTQAAVVERGDRKSTRLNSSHDQNSYAVF